MRARFPSLLPVALLALGCGCGRGPAQADGPPATSTVASASAPSASAAPPPADSWSLVAALPQCELRHRGLSLDLGNDSVHWRAGYRSEAPPDLAAVERGGSDLARVLGRRLRFEFWLDAPVENLVVNLRGLGLSARAVRLGVDDHALGDVRLPSGQQGTVGSRPLRARLARGRHTLTLHFLGKAPGPGGAFAELDWIRLGLPDPEGSTVATPTLRDVFADVALGAVPRKAITLRAPSSLRCPVLVAPGARFGAELGFWGAGSGVAELAVVTDGPTRTVLARQETRGGADARWSHAEGDLAPWEGQVVDLELAVESSSGTGRVAFGDAALVRRRPLLESAPRPPVVLVVVLSALDRSRIPPYGPIGELGALGKLARDAAAFTTFRAPSTVALPVLASLLTGLHPRRHGVADPAARLPRSVPTVATLAREGGVRAAFFTGVPTSFPAFGTGEGWDRVEAVSPVLDLPAAEPLHRATAWLDRELDGNDRATRLLLVHLRGGHPPWDVSREDAQKLPPDDYAGPLDPRRGAITLSRIRSRRRPSQRRLEDADWRRLRALEQAALVQQDAALGAVFSLLEAKGLWRESAILVLGDVAVGDPPHLPYDPVGGLREDLLLVPLLVKFPGNRHHGRRIDLPVTTVDVTATLLSLLSLPRPARFDGRELERAAIGDLPLRGRALVATLGAAWSTRLGSWLAHGALGSAPQLCALDTDPSCTRDVADQHPIAARALWIATWQAEASFRTPPGPAPREPASIDPDTAAALTVWGDAP